MTRTSFGFGTPIQPNFLNAVAYPKITGLPEDGHLDLLTNDNFLDQPGTIVYDYYEKINRLQASRFAVTGLTLTIKGCIILGPLGELLNVATQQVNVPDNTISWVWADNTGALQVTNFNPPSGVRSARVTTGSGTITQILDLRYDYLWIPNPATLAVFGGNSTTDYTVPSSGVTVLSGVINCRNFTVPVGATVEVDRTLTVRASGVTTIAGTIRTRVNPVQWAASGVPQMGVDSGLQQFSAGTNSVDNLGVPATNRNKVPPYGGLSLASLSASTGIINRATSCVFNINATGVTLNSGTSGAVLTIHSAGPVSVAGTAVVNCSAASSTTPSISAAAFSLSSIGGGATENWQANLSLIPPAPVAGTFVLQSSTSIVIAAGALITANGGNKVQGLSFSQTVTSSGPVTTSTVNWFSVGGGGGGAIHFQAPSVSSSPSATITTTAGSHTIVGGENVINGPGSGGDGFNATTATLPTNGPITTVLAAPIEF
jgi:hypothetical protein